MFSSFFWGGVKHNVNLSPFYMISRCPFGANANMTYMVSRQNTIARSQDGTNYHFIEDYIMYVSLGMGVCLVK